MKNRSVIWVAVAALALIVSAVLLVSPAGANNPIGVKSDGTPIKWGAFPINYTVDGGSLGVLTNAQANALTTDAFGTWTGVSSATLSAVQNAAIGLGTDGDISDVNEFNDLDTIANCMAFNPIVYDADGSIFADLGFSPNVLGFAGPCAITGGGVIVGGSAALNGAAVTSATGLEFSETKAVFIHELGHFMGLGHSQANLHCFTGFPAACPSNTPGGDLFGLPTMFPTLLSGKTEVANVSFMATLAVEDVSAISTLYPAGSFSTSFGTISGKVLFSDLVNGAQGINVLARRVGDPGVTVVSNVSGMFAQVDHGNPALGRPASGSGSPVEAKRGEFTIPGLPAGTYQVTIESVNPQWVGGSNVGPVSDERLENYPIPSPAIAECLSTPENNADAAAPCANIVIAAGGVSLNNDIILNDNFPSLDASDAIARNETIGTATPLGSGTFSRSLSGNSPDVDFYALSVTAGVPVTVETKSRRLTPTPRFVDSVIDIMNVGGVRQTTCQIGDAGGPFTSSCIDDDFNATVGGPTLDSKLVFNPPSTGTFYVRVTDSFGDYMPSFLYDIIITGALATQGTLSLDRNNLNFGNQDVGSTSAPQTIIVTNTGPGTLTLVDILPVDPLDPDGGDYNQATFLAGDCVIGTTTLAQNQSCNLRGVFTPTHLGPSSLTLNLSASNATNSPIAFTLSGTGTGANITFTNIAGGNLWTTPGNWDLNRIPIASDTVIINAPFTVMLDSGTHTIAALSMTGASTLTINGGASLTFTSPSTGTTIVINGDGFGIGGADGHLTADGTLAIGTLSVFNGGLLDGGGDITVATSFNLGSLAAGGLGSIGGTGVITYNGVISATFPQGVLAGRTFNSNGTSSVTSLVMNDGAIFNNMPGRTINAQTNSVGFGYGSGATPVLNNQGIFNRDSLGGNYDISGVQFNNTGTVTVTAGTLRVINGPVGQYTQTGAAAVTQMNSAAGGDITVSTPLQLQGGTLGGRRVVTGGVNNTGGIVRPGASAGILTFANSYVQGAGGALNIELGGLTPGNAVGNYDQLNVTGAPGTAFLGGTLNVNPIGFAPGAGNSFTIVTSTGALTGTFATTNLPALPAPLSWRVTYNANSVVLDVLAGPPASVTATAGTPQSATINTAFAVNLQATVRDSIASPVSGVTVTFTPPGGGASGTFAGGVNTAVTNVSGVATAVAFTANSTAGGPYNVAATVVGVGAPANFALTNLAGPPASITATAGTPQSTAINTAFATNLQATVRDASLNPVAGVTVTFTPPGGGASGTFAGGVDTAVTNASGVATAAVFTANSTTGGPYTVAATVVGVGAPANFALTNLSGPPTSITATAGTPQSATINTAFAVNLQATVTDGGGNLVSGVTVTFTAPVGGASGTFAGGVNTAVTNASGVAAAAVFTANSTAGGPYNVAATVVGVGAPANFALTNLVGAPATVTATAGTPQSAVINTAFAVNLQATVTDSGGNLVPGVTVTFTPPVGGASGTFAGGVNTAVTNASGVATAVVFTANSTAGGPYNVAATVVGVAAPANFALTNLAGPPASVTATAGTPQSAAISTAFSTNLQATVRDGSANPVSGVTVTFTPPVGGASGTFSGGVNTAVTNAAGVATAAVFTANSTAGGPYNVAATVVGVGAPANFALTNLVGAPATITATAGTPQSATINTAFATALQATVRDSGGNLVPGVTVTFTPPVGGASGTFAGGVNTAVTNASGVATAVAFTANSTAGGPYNVAATVVGVAAPANFALTNLAGPPASVTATAGTPQSTPINTAFTTNLQATVRDASLNPVAGVTVTFTPPGGGASGTFAGGANTAVTNAAGVATAAVFTANSTTGGPYTVAATVVGVGAPANFLLTNLSGPPTSITATAGTPQSATISTAFAVNLQATVTDGGGNFVSGVTVTFTAPVGGASGSFAGGVNTAVTNASGVATAAVFTANSTAGGPYNVAAAVVGIVAPANFALTNLVGAPATVTATAGTPQSAVINTAFAVNLQATVTDSGGNLVPGVTVTFTPPVGGASGTFAGGVNTAVTNASGVATAVVFTANSTAGGPYNVAATVVGVAAPANFALTNLAGPPASVTATGGTPQSAAISTAFASPLQATVTDGSGNPVPGVTVTFTAPVGGASGTFAGGVNTAVTNASGVATAAVFTANSTAGGPYNVAATVVGVAAPANFALTNLVGAPATVTATAGTPQSAVINTAFATALQATVRDSGGNLVPGVTVTFTPPVGGASGTFAGGVNTAVTNASGVATAVAFTANSTAGGPYNVVATVVGVAAPANFALTNLVGAPATVAATAGTPQSALINTAFAVNLQATVRDSGTNPVPGVTVTFTPPVGGASGTFAGGVNTAVTNAAGVATAVAFTANGTAGGPYTVAATVVGVAAPANFLLTNTQPGAILSSTTAPDFGSVQVGMTQAGAAITLTNNGTGPLTITGITIGTPGANASDFSRTTTCPAILAAGAICTITPSMNPQPGAVGPRAATITIAHNATVVPNQNSISLSGTAVDFALSFTGAPPQPVIAGGSVNYMITFDTLGGNSLNATTFACSGLPRKADCIFTPPSLPAGSADTMVALAISTTSNTATVSSAGTGGGINLPGGGMPFGLPLLFAVVTLGLLSLVALRSEALRASAGRLCLLALLLVAGSYLAGCASDGNGFPEGASGTPPGSYTVTVMATSGSVQRTTTVTLPVQ